MAELIKCGVCGAHIPVVGAKNTVACRFCGSVYARGYPAEVVDESKLWTVRVAPVAEGYARIIEILVINTTTGVTYNVYPNEEIPYAKEGDVLRIKTTSRNEGANDDMFAKLYEDTALLTDRYGYVLSWYIFTLSFEPIYMPNYDLNFTLKVGHIV